MKKLYGVIGDPISHSMSPVMHNDLFKVYGIDAHYHPFHVKRGDLEAAVQGLKAINCSGFNVTVPHKTEIMNFLDDIDPLAEAIGAVNTVVNKGGRLIGFNTDGRGFLEGLKRNFAVLDSTRVLIIGAGGAAKAIYYTMAHAGVKHIDFCNRTAEKAAQLIEACPFSVQSNIYPREKAENRLSNYNLIIQTTSVGMSPNINASPLSLENLGIGAFVSDIIYNPLETVILRDAKRRGAGTQNGLDMFVFQGAFAFEKWTGIFPDIERMKQIVLKHLGGK
ncbi:shikimate 5-dehydrogenase [Bacillus methanolicus PB1]|uniref:Shikimate dehydrogenase (NADP(+)) n=1 Tax=Bacillus methanolicus PB1 TaxID=997296 RepID=I3DXI3_BACMT|nr:shikimate dehydrogenase [Bacillus methanolicus]EIJ78954.1 shikimate 5-dehydrogenase [Bacillus methanolicus PB1]